MSGAASLQIESRSTEATLRIGKALGELLADGDVIGLAGKLGAGKTWFAKGLADGLNVPRHEYVNSPAYDMIHEYRGRLPVFHMDFYRIDDLGEEEYLWLEEYFQKDGVCIAEWADKFLDQLADDYLMIEIDWNVDTDVRTLTFYPVGQRNEDLLERLRGSVDDVIS